MRKSPKNIHPGPPQLTLIGPRPRFHSVAEIMADFPALQLLTQGGRENSHMEPIRIILKKARGV